MTNDPANRKDYDALFMKNQRVFGFGLDVSMALPCPFCAAPNWAVYKIMEMESVLSKNLKCERCARSPSAVFNREGVTTKMELVQTGGAAPPKYFPKIRSIGV